MSVSPHAAIQPALDSVLYAVCCILYSISHLTSRNLLRRHELLISIAHYIISKSDILKINCSSIALLEKCISQDTEPLQGAYDKI